MITLIAWIALLGAIGALIYYRCVAFLWIPGSAVILFLYSYFHWITWWCLIILWLLWLAAFLLIIAKPFRLRWFSEPLLKWFRQQQPELTQAEREVLEAGGTWWEQQFFNGTPDWNVLLEIGKPTFSEAEQQFLDNQVNTLCTLLDDWHITHHDKDLSEAAWNYIKKERFWGLAIPEQYGGLGFSAIAHSAIITKIASRSLSAALTVMVPNSLGPAEFLQHFGTDAQKQHYLPRLAKGEEIPCFALTAPEAGSDATSIVDTGIISKGLFAGKEIIGIRLTWEKRYITLAPVATLIGLAFKLYDPEHLLGDNEYIGITLALIPSQHPGVSIGQRHDPLHLGFMNGPVRGHDVFIPLDWVIGEQQRCGQGWQMMMECLAIGRGISIPAVSSAIAQVCLRTTGAYARIRRQFNRAIGQFEGVKTALARIAGYTYLCEATRWLTVQAVDAKARPAIASAITKYHLTELSRQVINDAMDVHAGRGIQLGPNNYLGNLYIGMPIFITVEGANILTRNLIIYGQGVMRSHPFLQQEITAAFLPDKKQRLRQFDRLLLSHLGFAISTALRVIVYGVTGGRFIKSPQVATLKYYYRQLTRVSHALALVSDIVLGLLGKKFKLRESLSARLGDILSYCYMGSAVLKYYNEHQDQQEQTWAEWALTYCLSEIYRAFDALLLNFPKRWLGKLLRVMIFPWGKYHCPSDTMNVTIADMMQHNSELRERLTQHCYLGQSPADPLYRVEQALQGIIKAQPITDQLKGLNNGQQIAYNRFIQAAEQALAAGHITESQYQQLQQLDAQCLSAIMVDEFERKRS